MGDAPVVEDYISKARDIDEGIDVRIVTAIACTGLRNAQPNGTD